EPDWLITESSYDGLGGDDATGWFGIWFQGSPGTSFATGSMYWDDLTFCTGVPTAAPPGDPGLPMSGFVCETITHSGGNDFAASRAFRGAPEIYINGDRLLSGFT